MLSHCEYQLATLISFIELGFTSRPHTTCWWCIFLHKANTWFSHNHKTHDKCMQSVLATLSRLGTRLAWAHYLLFSITLHTHKKYKLRTGAPVHYIFGMKLTGIIMCATELLTSERRNFFFNIVGLYPNLHCGSCQKQAIAVKPWGMHFTILRLRLGGSYFV